MCCAQDKANAPLAKPKKRSSSKAGVSQRSVEGNKASGQVAKVGLPKIAPSSPGRRAKLAASVCIPGGASTKVDNSLANSNAGDSSTRERVHASW